MSVFSWCLRPHFIIIVWLFQISVTTLWLVCYYSKQSLSVWKMFIKSELYFSMFNSLMFIKKCTLNVSKIAHLNAPMCNVLCENRPIQIYWKFDNHKKNNKKKSDIFSYFSARRLLRVPTVCFFSKMRKNKVYPCKPPVLPYKIGV